LDLKGDYQRQNILGVVQAIDILRTLNFELTDASIRNGLRHVTNLTGLKGRWQKLGDKPLVICDTGHNADGMTYIVRQIRKQNFQSLHMVIGMVKDKDIGNVLSLLPREAHYYFCQSKIPRALDAYELQARAKAFELKGETIPDVNEAIRCAKRRAGPDDMIFIGGSTFVVAEIAEL
jgi:dihydrofolate synthase/folylpolyglutamate synthase